MTFRSCVIASAVQFAPKLLDVDVNLKTALQLTYEAAAKGAKLVVLPELCTSGYTIRNPREAVGAAQEKNGYQTQEFVGIAKKFGCIIVFGYIEASERSLYNSAAVVGPIGLMSNHQKHNLYGADHIWATPSEQQSFVTVTPVGRLGVLICRDVMNNYRESYAGYRSDYRFYRKGSVDTIALLTNWGGSFGYPDSSWVELCEETGANVVVSNRVGEERDNRYKGGCCVIDRNRHVFTHGSNFTHDAVVGGTLVL